jgi:hypothetical protein
MNIIFGDALETLPDNYTVLELDTFVFPPDGQQRTSYCVIEKVPLADFPLMEAYIKVHADMMKAYRDKNWDYCLHALKGLTGRWNGELDSFYSNLLQRVKNYQVKPPGDDFTGYIDKSVNL